LHLVDLDFQPQLPADSTLVVRCTCTNRDLPNQLQHAGERLYFELEGAAPLSGIRCLKTPTSPLRAPVRRGRYWSLVSHLTLNYLSLTDPIQGREALCEILRLYDFSDPQAGQQQLSDVTRQLIEGITRIHTRRIIGRTGSHAGSGFAHGIELTVEFDEEKYVGTGTFLFACVLERFVGLYAGVNSFTQFAAKTAQTEGLIKKWPLRAGQQALL
jgi:type VI secretion system protein ImpG